MRHSRLQRISAGGSRFFFIGLRVIGFWDLCNPGASGLIRNVLLK
jgi:hypothetical protein